ncbi:MAG: outer membrane protein assembly factor BamA [Bacteroidales bacterium]|jgi:outer membrane protein insertion porin family|nr:outer membrane protein assembly factor BamA [Bacteroidales bacterium]
MRLHKSLFIFFTCCLGILPLFSQQTLDIDYYSPKEYEVGGITIVGADHLDHVAVIQEAGISVGDKITIPGDKTAAAIDKLWDQGIFDDVKIVVDKLVGRTIFLRYELVCKPRLTTYKFKGIGRAEETKIREKMKIGMGDVVTDNLKLNCLNVIHDFFVGRGFLDVSATIEEAKDTTTTRNDVNLTFIIDKGSKIRIKDIVIDGNEASDSINSNANFFKRIYNRLSGKRPMCDGNIRSTMKETKVYHWWRFWKGSRFVASDFEKDKQLIIDKYNNKGYRDATVTLDTMYNESVPKYWIGFWNKLWFVKNKTKQRLVLKLSVYEGQKYFFRNITWVGNTKYSSDELSKRLRIKKGDVYNKELLTTNMTYDPTGKDITSLYMDDGYLWFNVRPVEINIVGDSIDIEMRMYEGKQARIRRVGLEGNTVTNDYVVMRELRTLPGDMFSRDAVMRSIREIQQLSYFDNEKITPDIKDDQANGVVDIVYQVNEKSSSEFNISGGWGEGVGFMFTGGMSLTNFSARNLFKKDAWKPFPAGDGQRLGFQVSISSKYYRSLQFSFTEPWLGGRKPTSLTASIFYSYFSDAYFQKETYHLGVYGASVSLGKRLTQPDDYFTLVQGISFLQYDNSNYPSLTTANGRSNNLNYNVTLARNSVDQPIYPRTGSEFSAGLQLTFPYSLVNGKDYDKLWSEGNLSEIYNWIEYYKIRLKASWFFNLAGDLVVNARARFGFLGQYNSKVGYSPYERFYVGGDGLQNYGIDGRELIAMRGYASGVLSPDGGATVFDKFTLELRYPITLNPMASIYVLGFFEAGNSWADFKSFAPFQMNRSAGFGIRLFMPMFGLIGLDWGYGFDKIGGVVSGSHFSISLGQTMD